MNATNIHNDTPNERTVVFCADGCQFAILSHDGELELREACRYDDPRRGVRVGERAFRFRARATGYLPSKV